MSLLGYSSSVISEVRTRTPDQLVSHQPKATRNETLTNLSVGRCHEWSRLKRASRQTEAHERQRTAQGSLFPIFSGCDPEWFEWVPGAATNLPNWIFGANGFFARFMPLARSGGSPTSKGNSASVTKWLQCGSKPSRIWGSAVLFLVMPSSLRTT